MSITLFCPDHQGVLSGTEYEGMILPMLARELTVPWLHKHFKEGSVALQPKLDGVRFIYTGGSNHAHGHFHSRKGKPVATLLHNLREEVQDCFGDIPSDGELYGESGFREIISQVRTMVDDDLFSDTGEIEYHVYDLPIPGIPFSERYAMSKDLIDRMGPNSRVKLVKTTFEDEFEKLVPPLKFTNPKNKELKKLEEQRQNIAAQEALNIFELEGFEGTMIRRPASEYLFGGLSPTGKNKGKPSGSKGRSYELLKAKSFIDIEARVINVLQGEEGNRNEHRMGAIRLRFTHKTGEFAGKEIECKCGSGFTDEMRENYWTHPSQIVGKDVTIKFQEYSKDGVPRFPVFVAIRDYE